MTNKFNNWERVQMIIDRWKLSINAFATRLGFERSESLYHIRKGNYGISEDLARRITTFDPDIDRTWLLSGVGNMLRSDEVKYEKLPFYNEPLEVVVSKLEELEPTGHIQLPYVTGSDYVVRCFARSMSEPLTAANDLFLKKLSGAHEAIQGNEHVLLIGDNVFWRKIRYVQGNPMKWRLVSRNREDYPDIIIDASDVKKIWRVVTRIAILES